MGELRRSGWLLLALLLVGGAGCNRQDTTRLVRVGRRTAEKAETFVGGLGGSLAAAVPGKAVALSDAAVEARVASRLRWEQALADSPLQVEAKAGVVTLKGTLADLAARRRAVDLATTTVGVEKVNDQMQSPE
jgi:hypothetical protein